jgi:S-adenosylmethionine:tRNA ribosyltransferase-isomerase
VDELISDACGSALLQRADAAAWAGWRQLGRRGVSGMRALERVASPDGVVQPGEGWTALVVTPDRWRSRGRRHRHRLAQAAASHLQMLTAIAGEDTVERSCTAAVEHGYGWHELGDSHLILP